MLTFPTVGKAREWRLTESQVQSWEEAYPNVDVRQQMRRAMVWIQANPRKMKTARGMPAFLVNWLNRAVEKGDTIVPRTPAISRGLFREVWTCPHVVPCSNRAMCQQATVLGRAEKTREAS